MLKCHPDGKKTREHVVRIAQRNTERSATKLKLPMWFRPPLCCQNKGWKVFFISGEGSSVK